MDAIRRKAEFFKISAPEEKLCYILMFGIFMPFLVAAAIFLSVLVYILSKQTLRRRILTAQGLRWLAAFGALALIVPLARQYWIGAAAGLGLLGVVTLGLWISKTMRRGLYENCLEIAVFMSFPMAILAFAQKTYFYFAQGVGGYRPVSAFFNANYYGMVIEMIVLICVYKLLSKPSPRKRWYYLTAVMVNFTALYLVDSFSAFAAVGISLFVLLLLNKRYKLLGIYVGTVMAAAVLLFFFPQIFPRLPYVGDIIGKRISIWKTAFEGFLTDPIFGKGTLSYFLVSQSTTPTAYVQLHSHNILLDSLLNYGIAGTFMFVGFFAKHYGGRFKNFLKSAYKKNYLFVLGVAVSILVHGVTDVTILWHQTGILVVLLLSGVHVEHNEREAILPAPLRVRRPVPVLEGAALLRREVFSGDRLFLRELDEPDKYTHYVIINHQGTPIVVGSTVFKEPGRPIQRWAAALKPYLYEVEGTPEEPLSAQALPPGPVAEDPGYPPIDWIV